RHLMRNVWRYELVSISDHKTLVIESWDGTTARSKWWVSDSGKWVPKAMAKTLVKLKEIVEK
ncbi:MAG: polyketide cyclase / dehydrase and lipid transport, partial [Actinobacteria bacterium]|nr:polyketide cyclase / dehydrase and lipid transport [Actinomycetota bacterium]